MSWWQDLKDWWNGATSSDNKGGANVNENKQLHDVMNEPTFGGMKNTVSPTTTTKPYDDREPKGGHAKGG